VADRLLGRVSAADEFGSFVFLPSFVFGGLIVPTISPQVDWRVPGSTSCSPRPLA
jgi:hypothetical protein